MTSEAFWRDIWHWHVTYRVGGELDELDGERLRGWAEVDADNVNTLSLVPQVLNASSYVIAIPPGCTATFARRRTFVQSLDSGEVLSQQTVTIFGYVESNGTRRELAFDDNGNVVGA